MNFLLTDGIRELIEKELPREAGDLLRKRLEEAERLEVNNKSLHQERDSARNERDRLADLLDNIKRREDAVADAGRKAEIYRKALESREQGLELAEQLNVVRAESIAARMAHSDRVLDLIFGNRIIRSNVQAEVPFRRPDRDESGFDGNTTTHTAVGEGDEMRVADTTTTTEER